METDVVVKAANARNDDGGVSAEEAVQEENRKTIKSLPSRTDESKTDAVGMMRAE